VLDQFGVIYYNIESCYIYRYREAMVVNIMVWYVANVL
jgi:hypothetical protein